MKNLTTFLTKLKTKGHVEIIQETSKENLYLVLEMQIAKEGKIEIAAYYEEFDPKKVVINDINDVIKYQFGELAEKTEYQVNLISGYDIKSILSVVIASNFMDKKVVFTSPDKETELPNDDSLPNLYNMALKFLSISMHSLVCSHCTNDDYLTKYLLESESTNTEEYNNSTIEDVEKFEEKLIERFYEIKTTGEILSNKDTNRDTYYQTAFKWYQLYEDRKALNKKM